MVNDGDHDAQHCTVQSVCLTFEICTLEKCRAGSREAVTLYPTVNF